jgi:hypothetical protein
MLRRLQQPREQRLQQQGGQPGLLPPMLPEQRKRPAGVRPLRQQLLLQFADQPERVAEALRAIEGIPEGGEDMSVGGTKRDVLSRRLPRAQNITLG